jgi:hypothetical protein
MNEIGGFIGFSLLTLLLFYLIWVINNKIIKDNK